MSGAPPNVSPVWKTCDEPRSRSVNGSNDSIACSPSVPARRRTPCRPHHPVLRFELVKVAKLPILQIPGEEDVRIDSPRPARVRGGDVLFVLRSGRRRPQKQRGARCQDLEETAGRDGWLGPWVRRRSRYGATVTLIVSHNPSIVRCMSSPD